MAGIAGATYQTGLMYSTRLPPKALRTRSGYRNQTAVASRSSPKQATRNGPEQETKEEVTKSEILTVCDHGDRASKNTSAFYSFASCCVCVHRLSGCNDSNEGYFLNISRARIWRPTMVMEARLSILRKSFCGLGIDDGER